MFTADDGVTKIPSRDRELQQRDSTDLTAWVQLPVFHYNAATVIYMYYGNPTAASQQQTTQVWD